MPTSALSPRPSRRRVALLVVAVAAVLAVVAALTATQDRSSRADRPRPRAVEPAVFARDGVWNASPAADAPLRPDSAALVSELGRQVARDEQAGSGPWLNTTQYSAPIYTVGRGAPTVRVTLDTTYPPLARDFAAVPIPSDARSAAGTDSSLVVYQPSTDTMWELWVATRQADGWHARWGGKMTAVSKNPGFFKAPLGGTGTGLTILGGTIRLSELRAGRIDHALAFAVPGTTKGVVVPPAQRSDGRVEGGGLPEGVRFRLDPKLDLARLGLPPFTRMVAEAAQRYGLILRDTSGVVTLYGEDPTPVATGAADYAKALRGAYPNAALRVFPWDRLQAVR